MNCKLTKNISLATLDESGNLNGSCNGQDISMAGGLVSPVYIYNIDDVDGLKFEDDARADNSRVIDTVISDAPFYSIDFTTGTYNEEYEDGKWSHTLSLEVGNIQPLYESLLADAVNGRYLVAFRTSGDDDYRVFGWKFGASIDYSMNVADDSNGYTIELADESEYPLFTAYNDNFNVRDKVYTPVFKPLFSVSYCEFTMQGKNNGYAVALYVVKVNSAGQALDEDNKLCQWSGKKQDAYKYNMAVSDGGYNIIGEYLADAVFEGQPVRVYNTDICPTDVDGTILLNGRSGLTVNLNSTTVSSSVTVHSDNSWVIVNSPYYSQVTPMQGMAGDTVITVSQNGVGGVDTVVFQNRQTKERVTMRVNINLIKVDQSYTYQNGTTQAVITPQVEGIGTAYTYTISPQPQSIVKDSNGYLTLGFSVTDAEQNYTLTLRHSSDTSEVKTVNIRVVGNNTSPSWMVLSSFCEVE